MRDVILTLNVVKGKDLLFPLFRSKFLLAEKKKQVLRCAQDDIAKYCMPIGLGGKKFTLEKGIAN